MSASKFDVMSRRASIIAAMICGPLLMVFARLGLHTNDGTAHYLPLIGDISSWPAYMRSYWPLDLIETMIALGAVFYMMLMVFSKISETRGIRDWIKFVIWFFVAMGAMGSLFMSVTSGWIFGLAGFFELPAFCVYFFGMLIAVGLAMAACLAVLVGIGYLLRNTWIGQWVRYGVQRLKAFVEASDVPD